MQDKHMKTAVIGTWVLACGVIGLLLSVSSATGWILLIGSTVVPPLVLLQMWRPPAQTMSESIRDVLK
jgi:Cu/Ag efflux pump CusA